MNTYTFKKNRKGDGWDIGPTHNFYPIETIPSLYKVERRTGEYNRGEAKKKLAEVIPIRPKPKRNQHQVKGLTEEQINTINIALRYLAPKKKTVYFKLQSEVHDMCESTLIKRLNGE